MAQKSAPAPSAQADVLTDLLSRYGKQAIQLFAALAGVAGLFYAVGFVIVNVSLLRLGLYETSLIQLGYIAPGVGFVLIFALIVGVSVFTFDAFRQHLLGSQRSRRFLAIALGLAIIGLFSVGLGWAVWYGLNVAWSVAAWSMGVGTAAAVLAYADQLPLLKRMFDAPPIVKGPAPSPVQLRVNSPLFILAACLLAMVAVLTYARSVYDQIPPVFGGGQPVVVRFFGDSVGTLTTLGIGLEPGQTNLTERVELIAQTGERYIVRLAGRAVSFDKSFVQGIRYEPPEFFLNEEFAQTLHTKQGERFLEDGQYDQALSEFNWVLNRRNDYLPALRGRIAVALAREQYGPAIDDYDTLIDLEPGNGENHYGLARAYALGGEAAAPIIAALHEALENSPSLAESIRLDAAFDALRCVPASGFDREVYGSGPNAARWFRDQAAALQESGLNAEAITAYQRALDCAGGYASEPDALSPIERADIQVALSGLHLAGDAFSVQALEALNAAVAVTGAQDPRYLNLRGDLHLARGETTEALADYSAALRLVPADDPSRRQALIGQGRTAFEAGDYVHAAAAFTQALEFSGSDAAVWYDTARALAALGDPQAESALRRALELDPALAAAAESTDWQPYFANAGSSVANLIQGAVLFKGARDLRDQGDLEGAITKYQEATGADSGAARYWRELGDVLVRAGRQSEAVAAYQGAALRLTAPDAGLLTALGVAQITAGDAAGAVQSLTEAINAQGEAAPASAHAALARAYEAAGQYDLAASAYGQAAQLDASNPDYPYRTGSDLLLAGQLDQGLAALAPVIQQGGLRVEAADAIGIRAMPSAAGQVLATLSAGTLLRISDAPQVSEGEVWWPVVDPLGTAGYVRGSSVAPAVVE